MEKSGILVGDIMTRNFIHVTPDTDLRTCTKTMVKKRVGSLIIKKDDKLLGLLTEKDILWAIVKKSKKGLRDIKAKDVMKRKVYTIKPSSDILEATRRFRKKKIRRLPVIERGRVIGMLTLKDILKIDPGLFQMMVQSMKIKEETSKLKRSEKASRDFGICERCGQYETLIDEEGQKICENCSEKI